MYEKDYIKAIKYSHNESEQFLKAKLENVHDDLPHLVHADWLEEHDMPTTAHVIRKTLERKHLLDRTYTSISKRYYSPNKVKHGFQKELLIPNNNEPVTLFLDHNSTNEEGNHSLSYILHGNREHLTDLYNKLEDEGVPDTIH